MPTVENQKTERQRPPEKRRSVAGKSGMVKQRHRRRSRRRRTRRPFFAPLFRALFGWIPKLLTWIGSGFLAVTLKIRYKLRDLFEVFSPRCHYCRLQELEPAPTPLLFWPLRLILVRPMKCPHCFQHFLRCRLFCFFRRR